MHTLISSLLAMTALVPKLIQAQLSGTVGPLTSSSAKAAIKTCNITDTTYGAIADGATDISTALDSAFDDCGTGGLIVIPAGDYALANWVEMSGGSAFAIQLDGTILRTGTATGNLLSIASSSDFELFSSTGLGAIQGYGYEYHVNGSVTGPRLLRLTDVEDFSVHDVALVDSPAFHMVMDLCTNGEVYNMAIRGGNEGGLDGIDVWGSNIWVHDVMVTNKDECVTVKSPASDILVENIYCNWSGGCAIGSLGANTSISNILYRNVYTWTSNQMLMIKSNGGDGTVSNVVFENFIGHSNAYSLDIDQYWSSETTGAGDGVQLNNITFSNWTGTEEDGATRGPIRVVCADLVPCTDITITDFEMWTETGSEQWYECRSAYGDGFCLEEEEEDDATVTSYAATTTTVTVAPAGYEAATMPYDLTAAFGTSTEIPVPTFPSSFFPGITPISALAGT